MMNPSFMPVPLNVPESQHSVFIRGFPGDMDMNRIRDFFEKEAGHCTFDFFKTSQDGTRLYVAVRFDTREIARDVLIRFNNSQILGHMVNLTWFKDIRRFNAYTGQMAAPPYTPGPMVPPMTRGRGRILRGGTTYINPRGTAMYLPRGTTRGSFYGASYPTPYTRTTSYYDPVEKIRARARAPNVVSTKAVYKSAKTTKSSSRSHSRSPSESEDDEKQSSKSRSPSPTRSNKANRSKNSHTPDEEKSKRSRSPPTSYKKSSRKRSRDKRQKRKRSESKESRSSGEVSDEEPKKATRRSKSAESDGGSTSSRSSKSSKARSSPVARRRSKSKSPSEASEDLPVAKAKQTDEGSHGKDTATSGSAELVEEADAPAAPPPSKAPKPALREVSLSNELITIRNSTIADCITDKEPVLEKKEQKRVKKPKRSKEKDRELKLSAVAQEASDPERHRKITTLPPEKLQQLNSKRKEVEQAYKQDCETFATVVKMLISKDQSIEEKLLTSFRECLKDIGQKFLSELNQVVDSLIGTE